MFLPLWIIYTCIYIRLVFAFFFYLLGPISQTKCTTSKSKQSSVSTESNGADDEKVVATVVSEVQEYSASTESGQTA